MKCQKCGSEFEGNYCPNGCNTTYYKPTKKKKGGTVALIVVIGFFVFAIVMGFAFGEEAPEASSDVSSVSSQQSTSQTASEPKKGKVNYENFEKIKSGMTYDEVVEIFGKEGKIASEVDIGMEGYETTLYYWYDYTGIANCNITFQDGKVVAKAQAGLH